MLAKRLAYKIYIKYAFRFSDKIDQQLKSGLCPNYTAEKNPRNMRNAKTSKKPPIEIFHAQNLVSLLQVVAESIFMPRSIEAMRFNSYKL